MDGLQRAIGCVVMYVGQGDGLAVLCYHDTHGPY